MFDPCPPAPQPHRHHPLWNVMSELRTAREPRARMSLYVQALKIVARHSSELPRRQSFERLAALAVLRATLDHDLRERLAEDLDKHETRFETRVVPEDPAVVSAVVALLPDRHVSCNF